MCAEPEAGHVPPVELDPPAVRLQQPRRDVHKGGLAGAVGPDEAGDPAATEVHRDSGEGLDPLERFRHPEHGEGDVALALAHHTVPRASGLLTRAPYSSRSSRFNVLPTALFGNCSVTKTCLGTL